MVRRRRQRGMTLIEVMIALLIAMVGLLGALAMLGSLIGGTNFSRNLSEASALAQSKLEEAQSRVVTVSPATPPNGFEATVTGLDATGRVTVPPGPYTRTVEWGLTPMGDRRTITVRVSWKNAMGRDVIVTAFGERLP